jgi:hypothetical protein
MFGRDLLDVHAAFGAGHDDGTRQGAIQENGAIQFLSDAGRGGDNDFIDPAAFRTGLFGDEHVAQHGLGVIENFRGCFAEADAAFEAVLKRAFAAAAGMDLGLDGDEGIAAGEELFGKSPGGVRIRADFRRRQCDSVLGKKLPGLIFVDVHGLGFYISLSKTRT